MEKINVRLEVFEGPLDLLCHLIEKNEIDIYDIPIASLTDQYLEYIEKSENINMDNLSSFLVMAATLLEIKSKTLLPSYKNEESGDEEDPREALVAKLLEYKKFKEMTELFAEKYEDASMILYKDSGLLSFKDDQATIEELLDGITFEDICKAFSFVMQKREQKTDKIRSGFKAVERDLFTVEEKMSYIEDMLSLSPKIRFTDIFRNSATKVELIVTFLALLELIKDKKVKALQRGIFKEITIIKGGSDKQ